MVITVADHMIGFHKNQFIRPNSSMAGCLNAYGISAKAFVPKDSNCNCYQRFVVVNNVNIEICRNC